MVARGIIAKAIEHLEEEGDVDRIDIVYVCSNAAIAQQNVNRLNVTGQQDYALATRLTLLPLELHNLGERKLNFVSFTPGTTFDLKNSTGVARAHAVVPCTEIPGLDEWAHEPSSVRRRQENGGVAEEPIEYDKTIVKFLK